MNLLRATAAALPAVLLAVLLAGCAGPDPATGVVTGPLADRCATAYGEAAAAEVTAHLAS